MKRYQRPGDWLFQCEFSGFTGWASESALTWDGRRVLKRFLGSEGSRHPQEFVAVTPDDPSVPWARPLTPAAAVSYAASTITDLEGLAIFSIEGQPITDLGGVA